MDENNSAVLRGTLVQAPRFSHACKGERFYTFPICVSRSSGTLDILNVIAPESLMRRSLIGEGDKLSVAGELRSYNNKSGVGSKLVITVYARTLSTDSGEDENRIFLCGTLCKKPTLRKTPMGREISDLMVAVNRRYGRSDYLPCIAWGSLAREAACWQVGDHVLLHGRIQSRDYIKRIGDTEIRKTAYEVSVMELERVAVSW